MHLEAAVGLALSRLLSGVCVGNALRHVGAAFTLLSVARQRCSGQRRDLDLDIDPIEQWPRYPGAIPRDVVGRALAGSRRVTQVAAWARIHCRDELEARRKRGLPRRPRDMDAA